MLIGALRTDNRLPSHTSAGHLQNRSSIAEGARVRQSVSLFNPTAVERYVGVLHGPKRHFLFHLDCREAWRPLLDQEAFDLLVGLISSPDQRYIRQRSAPNPSPLSVQHPAVAVAAGGCGEAAGDSGADLWLREPEGTDLLAAPHAGQPVTLLLLRAA